MALIVNCYASLVRMVDIIDIICHELVDFGADINVLRCQAILDFQRVAQNRVDTHSVNAYAVIDNARHLLRRKKRCWQKCNAHHQGYQNNNLLRQRKFFTKFIVVEVFRFSPHQQVPSRTEYPGCDPESSSRTIRYSRE